MLLILVLVYTVASILWYLTLNSQVLLSQAVLHVAYANGIEGRERFLHKMKPLSQMQTHSYKDVLSKNNSNKKLRIEISAWSLVSSIGSLCV